MGKGDDPATRRGCLKMLGSAAAALAALAVGGALPVAAAAGAPAADDVDRYDIIIARVRFDLTQAVPDVWNIGPGGERNLLEELTRYVRCKVKLPQGCYCNNPAYGDDRHFNAVVDFKDPISPEKYPWLLMTAEGHFKFDAAQKAHLMDYIAGGGFIFMDDCAANITGDYFYQSAHAMINEFYGAGALKVIPKTHEVFNNVFDLSKTGLPRIQGTYYPAEGLWVGNRVAIILSSTDIHCGWIDKNHEWFHSAKGSGMCGYEEAIQFGINMIMYVLSH